MNLSITKIYHGHAKDRTGASAGGGMEIESALSQGQNILIGDGEDERTFHIQSLSLGLLNTCNK